MLFILCSALLWSSHTLPMATTEIRNVDYSVLLHSATHYNNNNHNNRNHSQCHLQTIRQMNDKDLLRQHDVLATVCCISSPAGQTQVMSSEKCHIYYDQVHGETFVDCVWMNDARKHTHRDGIKMDGEWKIDNLKLKCNTERRKRTNHRTSRLGRLATWSIHS